MMNEATKTEMMNALFSFKPGDLVMRRADHEAYAADAAANGQPDKYARERVRIPVPLTVLHRRVEQCHGGIQCFYVVSGRRQDGAIQLDTIADHEAVSFDEVKAVAMSIAPKKKD